MASTPNLPSPSHLRSLYRSIIRELPSRPLSSPSPLHTRIRSAFASASQVANGSSTAAPTSTTSPTDRLRQAQQADQYIQYVQAQRMYATLLERYNPGMGMSEEERVRLSARRVGMNLPVGYKE